MAGGGIVRIEGWLKKNTFHHSQFMNVEKLVRLKEKQGLKISLALPTLNEEETIAREITVFRSELMEAHPLIDELAIIDSGSTDRTCELAVRYGADVYKAEDYLKEEGYYTGKGENLWKSLYLLKGDIIIWIDADIKNVHPKFAYGLVGPLLADKSIGYVKAFYERPFIVGNGTQPSSGGRVTELLVRPLLNLFFPDLAAFIQPLSGEYAGRREILEQVPFFIGYGVETCLLIDICKEFGLKAMAQVDLDRRVHRHQRLRALSEMSFNILQAFFRRVEDMDILTLNEEMSRTMRIFKRLRTGYRFDIYEHEVVERPPMITIPAYRHKRQKIENKG